MDDTKSMNLLKLLREYYLESYKKKYKKYFNVAAIRKKNFDDYSAREFAAMIF